MLKKILYRIKYSFDTLLLKNKGVSVKNGAYVKYPYKIEGGRYIELGENVSINAYSKLACYDKYAGELYEPCIKIDDGVFANRFLTILSADKLEIGRHTFIGSHVSIINENHGMNPEMGCYGLQPLKTAPISIGENCWIGDKSTILPGVTIGNNTIIAAGSVVTKSIPKYCIAAGSPAKIIKKWNLKEKMWEKVLEGSGSHES